MAAEKKPAAKKGAPQGLWNKYEKQGDTLTRKNRSCPKCGSGFLLAQHKERLYCGACHYTEFLKAPTEAARKQ
jgi:small subunit ribosomal protein S27Ae